MNTQMLQWGKEGTIDLVRDIHRVRPRTSSIWNFSNTDLFLRTLQLIFQMTIRTVTCKELAEDKTAVQNMVQCYADMDRGTSPMAALFPWFPSTSRKAKERGIMVLYNILARSIEQRRNSPVPSTDPIDVLLGQDLSTDSIVGVNKPHDHPQNYSYFKGRF